MGRFIKSDDEKNAAHDARNAAYAHMTGRTVGSGTDRTSVHEQETHVADEHRVSLALAEEWKGKDIIQSMHGVQGRGKNATVLVKFKKGKTPKNFR